MPLRLSRIATVLVLASVAAGAAQAQTHRLHIGPRVSYQFDYEKLGLGGQFSVPVMKQLEFYPSFDYFFVDVGSAWNLNADLKYRFATESIKWLYAGGGLAIAHRSAAGIGNTDAGLNLFGGVESLKGKIHPFAEFRFTARNGSTAQISAGLNLTLH
ncbi:MAG TPA: hypothetical protein VGP87_12705 [Gemmatimonadales bacterium]|jgi:hypothetical protein|nr:hypothetical protein [Gemmatimonadales bacterium]